MNTATTRKEDKLLKKLNACEMKKCSKTMKLKKKLKHSFEKEQDKACPQKSNMKFYECSKGFYEKSEMKKLNDEFYECGKKKCIKEKKNLNTIRESDYMNYILKN